VDYSIHKHSEGKGINTLALGHVHDKLPLAIEKALSHGFLAVA